MGPRPLSEAFLATLRGGAISASEELEAGLQALFDAGRAAWPQAGLDGEDFSGELARRVDDGDALGSLARLRGGDLYLACACARGLPGAIASFEAHFLSRVPVYVARLDPTGALADEVAQDLRTSLLVPAPGAPARIGDYSGRGELAGWVRVVALRAALKLRRSQRRLGVGLADAPVALTGPADPERDYLRLRYRGEYEAAFHAALGALDGSERLFLKLHYVDGLSIDRLGTLYQLHRSTVARRLASHRRRLLELTRSRLRDRLGLSDSEFDSVLALVRSQMVVSLRGALK